MPGRRDNIGVVAVNGIRAEAALERPARRIFPFSRTDLMQMNLIGWMLASFMLVLAANEYLHPTAQRDFVYFYSTGYILNHYGPSRLHDFGLQVAIDEKFVRPEGGIYGPSPYPPFVAILFQPVALLPYWTAFLLCFSANVCLYVAALWLLIRRFCGADRWERALVLALGLSYWPVVSWVLLGGQLSVLGFAATALAICCEDTGKPFASGLALSICAYKPTLLLLILPMLLVTRRLRTLAGFACGLIGLISLSGIALRSMDVWLNYAAASARFSTALGHLAVPNYVDLRAFLSSLPSWTGAILLACVFIAAGFYLFRSWWKTRSAIGRAPATLLWATTLTWTLLLSLYVPIYDSTLVIASLIASAPQLARFAPKLSAALVISLLVLAAPAVHLAEVTGFQVLTPVLAAIGILQFRLLSWYYRSNPKPRFAKGE